MKGPFHRLRYELSRVWECQSCHHKLSTDGSVTSQMCDCKVNDTGKSVPMRLVADGPRRRQFTFEKSPTESSASATPQNQPEPANNP